MIRPATEEDLTGLAALEEALFGLTAWSRVQVAEEIARGRVRVADGERGVTAYVVTSTAGEVTDLLRIAVRPDHQGRGLAGILLTDALERAEGERMLLEVGDRNEPAIALYRGHGFAVIDRRRGYYRDGSDALVMSRSLA